MIAALPHTEGDKADVVASARAFLRQGLEANPECVNCLFGELVLDLHLDQVPRAEIVDQLVEKLSVGKADASRISVGQFVYLVKWQRSGAAGLSDETLERLFDAALANPAWPRIGRASLLATYREYFENVKMDLNKARFYAEEVVRIYGQRWNAHFSLVEILEKQGRIEEAILALEKAGRVANNERQRSSTKAKLAELERQRQGAEALSG